MKLNLSRIPLLVLVVLMVSAVAVLSDADTTDDGTLRLHLLWTNDVHGHIAPEGAKFMNPAFPPPLGGGASAARYIKEVRAKAAAAGEEVLLVDVGDMFQGTPIGNKTKGEAVIKYFNAVGYDFAVPGNHDFDKGRENTERLARMSEFPWICANLVEKDTGEHVDWVQPTIMLEYQGVKIGVVGIITPSTAAMSFPQNIAGLDFQEMPGNVAKFRDQLLDEGADIIFLAIHEGLPYDPKKGWQEIAGSTETETDDEQQGTFGSAHSYGGMNLMKLVHEVPGIDFAVGGHTHRGYHVPWIDPVNHTMCFESFGNGSSIGHAVLLIDRKTRELLGYEGSHDRGTLITLFEDEIWPDPEIVEVIRPYHEQAEAEMGKVIGSSAISMVRGGPTNLIGVMVTDAMVEYFDADFSFQNLGGIRANISAGDLTTRDIFSVLPFGNELVEVRMDGRLVRRVIERKLAGSSGGICISDVVMEYDTARPDYDRVVTLEIRGEPWDPDRVYKVIMTNFLMEGNSGLDFLTSISPDEVTPTQITTAEAVEHYIVQHSPIRPEFGHRWVEKPGQPQADYLKKAYMPES
ncbi:MAG: bifunctional metallophosphatase/5'-nucleotidase [Candidatus Krumholzibacteria bacterium]|nr:bifunctional metallophosphatase/5'-nucleotidase [Candidatus Krumholzibacteria bacterium]